MKINKVTILCIGLILSGLIYSCSDIFEKDLKNATVTLIAPGNGVHFTNQSVTFWWNTVNGAEQYDLQIVSPNFSSPQQFIADTLVSTNKLTLSLQPGVYQWRVDAVNNGGVGPFTTYSFTIDTSSLLTSQVVTLVSPVNNYATSVTKILFTWDSVSNSTEYEFQIINSANSTIVDVLHHYDTITETLPGNGTYTWQVKAENSLSSTAYFSRTITIDTSGPTPPTLVNPANDDSAANPVNLVWVNGSTAIGDTLYIYPDSLISPPLYKSYTNQLTYAFTGNVGSSYFWRLRSIDAANNISNYSSLYKFIIKK